jgi:hypothetical protein
VFEYVLGFLPCMALSILDFVLNSLFLELYGSLFAEHEPIDVLIF